MKISFPAPIWRPLARTDTTGPEGARPRAGAPRSEAKQTADPSAPTAEAAPAEATGFRSPATERAFERLAAELRGGSDVGTLADLEASLTELRRRAAELSAEDSRPYGRSLEHAVKQLFIQARQAFRAQGEQPTDPAAPAEPVEIGLPTPEEPTRASVSDGSDPAETPVMRLDRLS